MEVKTGKMALKYPKNFAAGERVAEGASEDFTLHNREWGVKDFRMSFN